MSCHSCFPLQHLNLVSKARGHPISCTSCAQEVQGPVGRGGHASMALYIHSWWMHLHGATKITAECSQFCNTHTLHTWLELWTEHTQISHATEKKNDKNSRPEPKRTPCSVRLASRLTSAVTPEMAQVTKANFLLSNHIFNLHTRSRQMQCGNLEISVFMKTDAAHARYNAAAFLGLNSQLPWFFVFHSKLNVCSVQCFWHFPCSLSALCCHSTRKEKGLTQTEKCCDMSIKS